MKDKVEEYSFTLLGVALGLGAAIADWYFDWKGEIGLFISLFVAIFFFIIDAEKRTSRKLTNYHAMIETMISAGSFQRMTPDHADQYIASMKSNILYAKNCAFYELKDLPHQALTQGMKGVVALIKAGAHWDDVSNSEQRGDLIRRALSASDKARLSFTHLKQNADKASPILEFCVIKKVDGSKTAIFRWSERFGGPATHGCFVSNNGEIFDLFDKYFDEIKKSA